MGYHRGEEIAAIGSSYIAAGSIRHPSRGINSVLGAFDRFENGRHLRFGRSQDLTDVFGAIARLKESINVEVLLPTGHQPAAGQPLGNATAVPERHGVAERPAVRLEIIVRVNIHDSGLYPAVARHVDRPTPASYQRPVLAAFGFGRSFRDSNDLASRSSGSG
jgi:hypothetical protein